MFRFYMSCVLGRSVILRNSRYASALREAARERYRPARIHASPAAPTVGIVNSTQSRVRVSAPQASGPAAQLPGCVCIFICILVFIVSFVQYLNVALRNKGVLLHGTFFCLISAGCSSHLNLHLVSLEERDNVSQGLRSIHSMPM